MRLRHRTWLRSSLAALGFIAVLILLGLAVQTHAVRGQVLAWVISRLERAGVVMRAERLDYNLFRWSVDLHHVSLATTATPAEPFFTCDEAHLVFGRTVLRGWIDLERVELAGARVSLQRDGAEANWPGAGPHPAASHTLVRLGVLRITDLGFAWRDGRTASAIQVPSNGGAGGISIDLVPTSNGAAGTIRMTGSGRVRWREHDLAINGLEGHLTWDARNLSVEALRMATSVGIVQVDGRADDVLGTMRLDARLAADADLGAIAASLSTGRRLAGVLRVDTRVRGPSASLETTLDVAGRNIAAERLEGIAIDATARIHGETAELATLTVHAAGGSLSARGRMSLGEGPGVVHLDWQQLDVATLIRAITSPVVVPAADTRGSIDAQWSSPHIQGLRLQAAGWTAGHSAGSGAEPGRRSDVPAGLLLEGSIAVDLRGQSWTARAEQTIARRARAVVEMNGGLDARSLSDSSIEGTIRVTTPDIGRLAGTDGLAPLTGLGGGAPVVSGAAHADLIVTGTFGTPQIAGSLDAVNLRYGSLPAAAFHARAAATSGEIRFDDIDGRMGESSVSGHLRIASKEVGGKLDVSVRNIADFSSLFPAVVDPQGSMTIGLALSGSRASPHVTATAASDGLAAAGQRVDGLDADLSALGRVVTLDRLEIRSGDGRLSAHGSVDPAGDKYAIHAAMARFPVCPVPRAPDGVMAPLTTSVTGGVDSEGSLSALARHSSLAGHSSLAAQGKFSLAGTRWADADLGQLDVNIAAAGRTVSIEMRAPDLAFTGAGGVGIDPGGLVSVHGRWEPDDLAALSRRLGWMAPTSLTGTAALAVEIAGTRDRLQDLKLTFDLERLSLDDDGRPIRLAHPARFEYDGRVLDVRSLTLTTGSSTLSAEGSLGRSASQGLAVTVEGLIGDFAFVPRATRPGASIAEHGEPGGTLALRFNATGPLTRPIVAGSMRIAEGRLPLTNETAVTDIGLDARYDAGVLVINRLGAAFQGATLEAAGQVPAGLFRDSLSARWRDLLPQTGGQAVLKAQITSLTPAVVVPLIGAAAVSEIGGRVDASLELQTDRPSLDRVRGSLTLDRAELSFSGVSFDQQTPTRLVFDQGHVDIANWQWGLGDNRVTLTGGMPLGGDRVIDVTARAALDLRLLNAFTRAARTTGRADGAVHVGGTLGAPTLDGYITFANGELRVASPRLVLNDLTGTISLARDALTLEQLSASLNGGEAIIAGTVHHKWFRPLDGRIALQSRGAALDVSGLRAETDADLSFDVERREPLISGTVTLVRSAYREQLSLTSGLLRALQTSSDSLQSSSASWLDTVRLNVRILTQDDLIVDNNYAQLAAASDIRIVGTAAQPGIVGRATLAEGGLVFFGGNRYRLAEQGSIDFVNPTRPEPDLNLRAVTKVQNTEITLTLKGTPAALDTSLTSTTDPNYSQSDLVSLLVTGRTAAEAAATGYTPGSEELLGYLSGELFGAAGRAVGLDIVRIERGTPDVQFDAGLVAGETDPGARLTFGKNIGRNVQVVFSQSLRQSGGLTWIVSYAPRSRIELRAVSLDNGSRSYDFRHDVTFGGPSSNRPRAPAPETLSVAAVHVISAGTDEPALRARLKLTAGDRFSFFRWQDDRDRLEAFYHERDRLEARVTTKRVVTRAAGDGPATVEVTYEVRPGPRTTIAVAGFSFPRTVISALKTEWTHAVVDDFLAERTITIARGALVDRGFVSASVVARVTHPSPDDKHLEITVDRGLRTTARRVVFRGNRHIPGDRLLTAIGNAEPTRAVWLEPDRVRDTLRAFYRREGYLNASIAVEAIQIAGRTATRTIDVEEGEQFPIREIRVEGARASSADEVRSMSGLSGRAFSETAIDNARRAIDRNYRTRGFNTVGITLRTEVIAGRSDVGVTIGIEEGAQQRLRDVAISGLMQTKPALVSRALELTVGEPVNLAEWYRARQRLYETGIFRNVDIEPEPMAPAAPADAPHAVQEQPIRARVTLEEWPPFRLRYGLELNDERTAASDAAVAFESTGQSGRTFGVGLAGDAGTRNLFGLGISAGLAGRYTRDFRAARVYLTSPSLFGLRITSNVFVSRSREEFGNAQDTTTRPFVTDKTDLTLEQRVRPLTKMEISWRYAFERNHTFELHPDPNFPVFDIPINIARLASSAIIDRRNDLVDATQGWFHSSNLEYGAPSLGSDLHFIKYLLQQRYYRPVGSLVFAGSVRLGLANSFEQSLIPSERFFAGGGNSVRGYGQDTLSPRDAFGVTVGGNALFVWNGEVRFPIVKIVRGVGFLDAGRAFDTVAHLTLRDLPAGAGAGLRIQTPVVLIRIDYGVPLDSTIGLWRGRWFFSIGQAF